MKPYHKDFTYTVGFCLGGVCGGLLWIVIAIPVNRVVSHYYPHGENLPSPEQFETACVTMLLAPVALFAGAALGVRMAKRYIAKRE